VAEAARLRGLQRFVQAVIVHPGTTRRAAALAARRELRGLRPESALRPSRTLSAIERIGIYQGMYPLRMHDALAADFPGLKAALGDEEFRAFVRAYVRAFPSKGYTLNRLGDHVPDFLARTRRWPHRPFLRDLARLELAVTEVFDAFEPEPVAKRRPVEAGSRTTFRPAATLRLLKLGHPAGAYLDDVRAGRSPRRPPPPRPSYLVLWRRGFEVRRLDLSPGAFTLTGRLAAGRPLGEALAAVSPRHRRELSEHALARLFRSLVAEKVLIPC
jgi:hypothetical protein